MESKIKLFSLLIILLYLNPIISDIPDLSFANKEIIENDDLCLKRPYHKRAEPFYFFPALHYHLLYFLGHLPIFRL